MTWEERLEIIKSEPTTPSYSLDATIGYLFYKLDIIDKESNFYITSLGDDVYRARYSIWLYSLNIL